MSGRLRRIERLLRLREIARNAASAGHAEQTQRVALAEREIEDEQAGARELARDRAGYLGEPRRAGFVHAAALRQGQAQRQIAAATDRRAEAEQDAEQTRCVLVEADRRVRAIEKLRERAQREERDEARRREQSRIDEMALLRSWRRRRVSALLLAFVWLVIGLVSPRPVVAQEMREKNGQQAGAPKLEASFDAIRLRQLELDQLEREMNDRDQQLSALERTVEARLLELEKLSERVEARIAAWEEAEGGKSIARLSRIYAAMSPENAAALVASLDLELATQIVSKMKPKQSSALMALLGAERARQMSERIAHPLSMDPVSSTEAAAATENAS